MKQTTNVLDELKTMGVFDVKSEVESDEHNFWFKEQEWYSIEKERINTAEKLAWWIIHLSNKNWVTKKHIADLVLEVDFCFNLTRCVNP